VGAAPRPWVFHELPDCTIDVTGTTRPERDVAAFIDLCHARGLWFIARPGPFVMAELKHEGIPYRVYEEHPEVVPCRWDGTPTRSCTVDYLAPSLPRRDGPLVRRDHGGGLDSDGRTTALLASGTTVADDAAYDVTANADGRVRVTGGPGPLTLRWG